MGFLLLFCSLFFFQFVFKTGSRVAQAGLNLARHDLELVILLPLSSEGWDNRLAPPCAGCAMLEKDPGLYA